MPRWAASNFDKRKAAHKNGEAKVDPLLDAHTVSLSA